MWKGGKRKILRRLYKSRSKQRKNSSFHLKRIWPQIIRLRKWRGIKSLTQIIILTRLLQNLKKGFLFLFKKRDRQSRSITCSKRKHNGVNFTGCMESFLSCLVAFSWLCLFTTWFAKPLAFLWDSMPKIITLTTIKSMSFASIVFRSWPTLKMTYHGNLSRKHPV